MISLAVKYRPKEFEDVSSQNIIVKILNRQLELREFPNCLLLTGGSGVGKTTIARIYANKINNGYGQPEEIDAASNNGVDNIRNIILNAKERSLDSEYKIFIIDEAHMITTQGWNAFLKCLEEPPKYTIFIFCTTDPQKIPETILNRMMRLNLNPIEPQDIEKRLDYICQQENFTNYKESINYISKISEGGMRKAISYLEKVSMLGKDISLNNTLSVLGDYSTDIMFALTNRIINKNDSAIIKAVDYISNNGGDLKLFLDQYIDFILDLTKYCLLKDIKVTKIPTFELDKLNQTINIPNNEKYFKNMLNNLFNIKLILKNEPQVKTTLTIKLLELIREN